MMSTSAKIMDEAHNLRNGYIHYDGYPEGVGMSLWQLMQRDDSEERLAAMIGHRWTSLSSEGPRSSLADPSHCMCRHSLTDDDDEECPGDAERIYSWSTDWEYRIRRAASGAPTHIIVYVGGYAAGEVDLNGNPPAIWQGEARRADPDESVDDHEAFAEAEAQAARDLAAKIIPDKLKEESRA